MPIRYGFAAALLAAVLAAPVALADPAPGNTAPGDTAPDGAAQGGAQSTVMHHGWHMPGPEDMAKWHAKACNERYALAAGKLAFLEAELSITSAQHGVFARWRDGILSSAKSREETCLARAPQPEHRPNALELADAAQKRLTERLESLRSERPALEALYAALTPDQKAMFDDAARHLARNHMDHDGWHHEDGHHGERFGGSPDGHVPG
jgi:hypothetical protein